MPEFIKSIIKKLFKNSRRNFTGEQPKSQTKSQDPTVWLDVTKYGCFNGEDVMSKLVELVEIGERECFAHSNSIINEVEGVKKIGEINNISNKNEVSEQKQVKLIFKESYSNYE